MLIGCWSARISAVRAEGGGRSCCVWAATGISEEVSYCSPFPDPLCCGVVSTGGGASSDVFLASIIQVDAVYVLAKLGALEIFYIEQLLLSWYHASRVHQQR